MTTLDLKAIYDRIVTSCAENLRSVGYVRRGSSLRKVAGGNVAIVEFQKSSKSNADAIVFTINLGIVCGQLLESSEPSLKGVGIVDAHVRQRIGMLLPDQPDKWWTIDPNTNANSLIEEISGLIEREAASYLDSYLDDDALVALWESGQSPGLTETQRLRYLTMLTSAKERNG